MKLTLPTDVDAARVRAASEAALGLPARVERTTLESVRDLEAVLHAVQIPFTLLATWDLAERIGLLARVRAWLDAVRALPGGERVSLTTPGFGTRALVDVTPGEVLDAAAAEAPLRVVEAVRWEAFLIHAGADRATARAYYEALVVAGLDTYLDRAVVRPGDDWPRRIAKAMEHTRVFVVLASRRWGGAWYVDDEVARAISLARADAGRVLLPVDIEREPLPVHELPYGTAHLQPLRVGALEPAEAAAAVVGAVRGALARPGGRSAAGA